MTTSTFTVAPIAGALGAEITGVDLRSADDAKHNALNDYHGFRRELYRTTVAGTVPI